MSDGQDHDPNTPIHGLPLLTKRDLMNAAKAGIKELLQEYVTSFGYFSAKTLGVAALGAMIVFVLWLNGYGKHG